MRVSVFTSNQPRHMALLDVLTDIGHKVTAIIEPKTWHLADDRPLMRQYWSFVQDAEIRVFGERRFTPAPSVVCLPGEASTLPVSIRKRVLESDRILVFGASYLKGEFADALIARGALNLHVGIAPEYRGSASNFWAAYDGNHHLVGAQIQRLSTGLDTGAILAEVRGHDPDPFIQGMRAAEAGIYRLVNVLVTPPAPLTLVGRTQIRYSRYSDFTEDVVREYLTRIGRL